MRKITATALLSLALFSGSATIATPARAGDAGPAIAAGIGGLAVGAILGGALAHPAPPAYYPAPVPVYVAPPPRCWVEPRPVFDEYGNVIGSQPRRYCR